MHPIRFVAIDPAFEVHAADARGAGDSAREAAVERLWNDTGSQPARPRRDGPVLVWVEADRRRLIGRLARWRDVFASRREPELFGGRILEPVQVGGLVACQGRLLLGQLRSVESPGADTWELVSARALTDDFLEASGRRVDYRAALQARLAESTPLLRRPATAAQPFALAHDAQAGVWQVCVTVELEPGAQALEQIERSNSRDYAAFRFVRPVDVIESGMSGVDELAPLSAALVRLPRAVPHVA